MIQQPKWARTDRFPSNASPGFTLVEVLVALAVMALALVALLRLQVISIVMADRAALLTRATLLADAQMTEVRAGPLPGLGVTEGVFEDSGVAEMRWQVVVSPVRVAELDDARTAELRKVAVRVTWRDGERLKRVELVTYVLPR